MIIMQIQHKPRGLQRLVIILLELKLLVRILDAVIFVFVLGNELGLDGAYGAVPSPRILRMV